MGVGKMLQLADDYEADAEEQQVREQELRDAPGQAWLWIFDFNVRVL